MPFNEQDARLLAEFSKLVNNSSEIVDLLKQQNQLLARILKIGRTESILTKLAQSLINPNNH